MKFLVNNLKTNWKDIIDKEFTCQYLKNIDTFLFNEQNHTNIFPEKENIFRAFNFFNIEETKIVIFGQDPYFKINQANGLCFSVNENITTPPSLRNIFKKLYIDKHITRTNPDLSDWAKQGFLLLNSCLTVSENEANSHQNIGWNHFIDHIIERLNKNNNPILFICFGNFAKKYIDIIDKTKHQIISWPHPSPLAATRCGFFNNNLFDQIDEFMNQHYHKKIEWN